MPFLFKAFESGQARPPRPGTKKAEEPRAATIHEYLDWTVTSNDSEQVWWGSTITEHRRDGRGHLSDMHGWHSAAPTLEAGGICSLPKAEWLTKWEWSRALV